MNTQKRFGTQNAHNYTNLLISKERIRIPIHKSIKHDRETHMIHHLKRKSEYKNRIDVFKSDEDVHFGTRIGRKNAHLFFVENVG